MFMGIGIVSVYMNVHDTWLLFCVCVCPFAMHNLCCGSVKQLYCVFATV